MLQIRETEFQQIPFLIFTHFSEFNTKNLSLNLDQNKCESLQLCIRVVGKQECFGQQVQKNSRYLLFLVEIQLTIYKLICVYYILLLNQGRNLFVFRLIGSKKRNKKLIGYDMLYSRIGAYPYYIHTKSKMFLLLPCATVKDKVTIPAVGDAVKIAHEMNKARQSIKQYSNVEYLLQKIQEGQVIMTKKVEFDNYMKSQVDLMRGCVSASFPCPFTYASYMDSDKVVSTAGLSTKEQWAIEMVMSRYTISSIYHAAAYSSLAFIFSQTAGSYQKNYKNTAKLVTNLQIAFKYFNEGYQPLKRLSQSYQTLQLLFSKANKETLSNITEIRREVFLSVQFLVACNLGYLKLQKYRLMSQFKSCKQLAYSIYNLVKDTKMVLSKAGSIDKVHTDMRVYLDIAQLFFLAYSYYFLLEEHEMMKTTEQYGFIKKEFQQMIVQNCVVCEQFAKLAQKINEFPGKQNLDNVMFADSVTQVMLKEVNRKQYTYGIKIHENKQLQVPTIDQVIAHRIGLRKIDECIGQF